MVRFRIAQLLAQTGKTKYWLYQQLGMSYQSFMPLYRTETRSISRQNIDVLCQIFACTPNDLFEICEDIPEEENKK